MQDRDLYWLAGLLEGEGSFMAGPPSAPNQPRISVQMTDLDVIERVAALFGVSYIHERQGSKAHHATAYTVNVRGTRAMDLMRKLKPFMGDRRQLQIEDALDSYDVYCGSKSKSEYKKERVVKALHALKEGSPPVDVAKQLNLKHQFVRDLNAGRTWKKLRDEIMG